LNICTFCKIVAYPKCHLLPFLLFISLECLISYISYMSLELSCLYKGYIKCVFKCIILQLRSLNVTYLEGLICTNLKCMYIFGTTFMGNYRLHKHR